MKRAIRICTGYRSCGMVMQSGSATGQAVPHLYFEVPRIVGAGCRVQGSGCRVQGSGCRVQGAGFRVQGSGFRIQGAGFWVQGSGLRFQGSGFRVQGLGRRPRPTRWGKLCRISTSRWRSLTTLEATQEQIDGCFSQLPYTCHQNRVASVGD